MQRRLQVQQDDDDHGGRRRELRHAEGRERTEHRGHQGCRQGGHVFQRQAEVVLAPLRNQHRRNGEQSSGDEPCGARFEQAGDAAQQAEQAEGAQAGMLVGFVCFPLLAPFALHADQQADRQSHQQFERMGERLPIEAEFVQADSFCAPA